MNQRLAAHKVRKGLSVLAQPTHSEAQSNSNSRAAQAAARVAARYAQAPTYSEMQAAEARAALRAAGVATRAALEAQAAAQVALDNLETADAAQFTSEDEPSNRGVANEPLWQAKVAHAPSEVSISATGQPVEIRWEPDMPVRPSAPPVTYVQHGREEFQPAHEDWRGPASTPDDFATEQSIETVEPAQPIHANLIHFPREIVATRRIRPRIASPHTEVSDDPFGQLSIFEVDPGTISTEVTTPVSEAGAPAPLWSGPEWSGIELDAQPETHVEVEAESAKATAKLHLAPFGLRLMAAAVDAALIVGLVCGGAALVANYITLSSSIKAAELGAVIAIVVASALYLWLFLALVRATPGMKYARISLCTFDDEIPSREQLRKRLGAMLLSLLPMGLGVAWAIFDDDHLSWHDRLSRTYLRSN